MVAIPKPPVYGPVNLAKGILTRWPVTILNYHSAEMMAAVRRLTADTVYDLVHFDIIHVMGYESSIQRKPRAIVYNWHNIESEAMQRYSETVSSPLRRWYARQTAAKLRRLEYQILDTARGHVVCSDREREQLHQVHRSASIAVVENGVDVPYFAGACDHSSPPNERTLVFVGSMDYFPNQEACSFFTHRIWPQVRQTFPGLRLILVGANPPPSVLSLGTLEGVTVTGTVPDVRPYYRNALAAIVPLRTGSGTRLKILEAMAAGVPVVSSPLGAEGLAVTPDKDILIADPEDPAAWVKQITALTTSPDRCRQLASASLELVRARYDWDILGQTLKDTYNTWLQNPK